MKPAISKTKALKIQQAAHGSVFNGRFVRPWDYKKPHGATTQQGVPTRGYARNVQYRAQSVACGAFVLMFPELDSDRTHEVFAYIDECTEGSAKACLNAALEWATHIIGE